MAASEVMLSVIIGLGTGLITGFLTGFLTGLLSWRLITKVYVPRIEISEFISRSLDITNGRTKYRIKIINRGKRPAFEFSIVAEIRFRQKDLRSNGNTQIMRIGVNTVPLAFLDVGKSRIMNLKTELIPEEHSRHLSEEHREMIRRGKRVPLEDILKYLGEDARVRIYIMCSDGVSGNRKYFMSKDLAEGDITNDRFEPDGIGKLEGGPI